MSILHMRRCAAIAFASMLICPAACLPAQEPEQKPVEKPATSQDEAARRQKEKAQRQEVESLQAAIKALQEENSKLRQYNKDMTKQVRRPTVTRRIGFVESQILAELDKPTVIEFIETPLQDVIDYLKELHKIEIQLDKKALDDVGIDTSTPVSRYLRGVKLQSALDLILGEFDLEWVIDHEVLLLTTKDFANAHTELRTYDVSDLVDQQSPIESLAKLVKASFGRSTAGHSISPFRGVLVIRDTQQNHREVERLLDQLRMAKK